MKGNAMLIRLKRFLILQVLIGVVLFAAMPVMAVNAPMPAENAFIFSPSMSQDHQKLLLNWQIAPGYYLYKERVYIKTEPNAVRVVELPQGDLKYNTEGVRYEAYSGALTIPISINANHPLSKVVVGYQGCAAGGFCYPPIEKTFNLSPQNKIQAINNRLPLPSASLMTNQNSVQSLIDTPHFFTALLICFGLGILLAFTPCVLPMVPILASIVIGQKKAVTSEKALLLSGTYVLGVSITYAAAGVIAAELGSTLNVWLQKTSIIAASSGLFVLLALSLFDLYHLHLPSSWHGKLDRLSSKLTGGTYASVFFMGVFSSLMVSPCITAPMVGVLMYISQTKNWLLGGSALFVIGLGMGMPLLLVGISAGKWLPKSGPWMEGVKKGFGWLMLAMAVWLLNRILTPAIALSLWGLYLFGLALFIGIYVPKVMPLRRLHQGMGILIGLFGVILMVGGLATPTMFGRYMDFSKQQGTSLFTAVADLKSFHKQLSLAHAARVPILLDFYATWCEACVAMDHHVFNSPLVKDKLKNFILLRIDLSHNTADDYALLRYFKVVAPPTVIFFNAQGKELSSYRIVGGINSDEMMIRLSRINNIFASNE